MENIMPVETSRLILRKFSLKDENDVFEILSDEDTTMSDSGTHAFKSKDESFKKLLDVFQQQLRYSIVLKDSNKVIGQINLTEADRAVETYEIGFLVNKDYRRKGYAYEAVSALIDEYFRSNKAEMFIAGHFPFNIQSERLLTKLQFIKEGIMKNAYYHGDDEIMDLIRYYRTK